jgi:hypothetical protein
VQDRHDVAQRPLAFIAVAPGASRRRPGDGLECRKLGTACLGQTDIAEREIPISLRVEFLDLSEKCDDGQISSSRSIATQWACPVYLKPFLTIQNRSFGCHCRIVYSVPGDGALGSRHKLCLAAAPQVQNRPLAPAITVISPSTRLIATMSLI